MPWYMAASCAPRACSMAACWLSWPAQTLLTEQPAHGPGAAEAQAPRLPDTYLAQLLRLHALAVQAALCQTQCLQTAHPPWHTAHVDLSMGPGSSCCGQCCMQHLE